MHKSSHKISHFLRPKAKAVIWTKPESDPLANLGMFPWEAGGTSLGLTTATNSEDPDFGSSHFGELILPWRQLCWQVPFGILPLGYSAWTQFTHQLVFTGPGTSQVKWPPGLAHAVIHLQVGCHRNPQTLFILGPSPTHKRAQDLATPSRGPILAPRPLGSSSQPSDKTIKCTNVCITESQKKERGRGHIWIHKGWKLS